jgi:O-antigen/teichoic acid export membrane protein
LTKKFTQSIFILLFLNLLVKPFWIFGIDRTIQNRVGAEEYGHYFSLLGFSLLLNMISDLGITNYNNRNIAQNHDKIGEQLGLLIPVKLLLSIVYCTVTLVLALIIGYSSRQFNLLIWLIINQMLASIILYLRSNISALQLFVTDSIISVIDKFLTIIICGILLWANLGITFRIEWLVFSQAMAYISTFIIVLYIVLKNSGKINFKLNFKTLTHTLKMSFPFALLALIMIFYTRIDAVMLERMLPNGKTEAGIYAQAYRISDALSMFAVLFASILLPLFAKMLKDKEPISDTLSHSFALLMVPALAIIVVLLLSVNPLMEILYNKHGEQSAKALFFLIIGFGGICLSYIFGTLLTSAGKLMVLNKIAFLGLILNLVLNLFLIPAYGSTGAAISSMITQLFIGFVQVFISLKIMQIKVKRITPVKYGIILISAFLLFFFLKLMIPWYLIIFVVPGLIIILGVIIKLIKIDNLRQALIR